VRGQQKAFETALWYDYLTSSLIALVLSFIGSQFIPRLWFFAIILSPIAGTIIAEACRAVVQKKAIEKVISDHRRCHRFRVFALFASRDLRQPERACLWKLWRSDQPGVASLIFVFGNLDGVLSPFWNSD
jgi:hypothetical protein